MSFPYYDDLPYIEDLWQPEEEEGDMKVNPPRTQKGKGLMVLRNLYPYSIGLQALRVIQFIQSAKDITALKESILCKPPFFARPCPPTPQHGYIDSRKVNTWEEVDSLFAEVMEDNKESELMLTPVFQANYNAIWTPGSLGIGPGHDGATSGHDAVVFPLSGTMPDNITAAILKEAKIGKDEWPFIEVIYCDGLPPILTQLRAGPVLPIAGDYIPETFVVKAVIKAKGDLMEWKNLMDSCEQDGVVVWHPGGLVTDHYCIHSYIHHIPFVLGDVAPKVGDVLKKTSEKKTFSAEAMLRGVVVGSSIPLKEPWIEPDQATVLLLAALHNSSVMTGEESKWLGVAASLMLRLGVTALKGEARHLSNPKGYTREQVYNRALPWSITRQRAQVNRLVNVFRYGAWNGAGIGGPAWAQCGASTVWLFNALHNLAVNPNEQTAADVVSALNVAVNQAHNGGWWLNKFCSGEAFDAVQKGNLSFIIPLAPSIYKVEMFSRSLGDVDIAQEISRIASWPETNLKPPKVKSVQLTYQPGINAIGLKLETRVLGLKARTVLAPANSVISTLEKFIGDYTYLVETDNGYRVEVRHPEKGTFVLWEDEAIGKEARKQ